MSSDAYRNDKSALQERRSQLSARVAELRALDGERKRAAEELAAVEKRLSDMDKRALPLLDRVSVASPCAVPWSEMKGDDRVRFCGQCSKNVFNLSALTREEATAFVASVEGSPCVRFYRRPDGTMLTADCPVGVRRRRRRRFVGLAVGAVAALGVGTAAFVHVRNARIASFQGAVAGEMVVEHAQGAMMEMPDPAPAPQSPATATAQRKTPAGTNR